MWKELKDKSDDSGFSFRQFILPGCMDLNCQVGVRAGSKDSYKAFASLADKILADYHNMPVPDNMPNNHPHDTTWTKL
jgi:hypothetical protein